MLEVILLHDRMLASKAEAESADVSIKYEDVYSNVCR